MVAGDIQTNRLDVLLKQNIAPDITKVFQQDVVLYDLIPTGTPDVIHNKGAEFVMYTDPETPPGWRGEGAAWPQGEPLTDLKGRVRYVRLMSTLSMTLDTYLHLTKLSDQEIIDDLSGRIQRHIDTDKIGVSYMFYGKGDGEVARVKTTPGGFTNFAVEFAESVADGNTFGVFKVFKNATYNWYSTAGVQRTTGTSSSKVTARNPGAIPPTATFDSIPTDVVATDRLFYNGDFNFAPYGLDYFFQTSGSVQNLSLDSNVSLRATKVAAAGADINAAIISRMLYEGRYRIEGDVNMSGRIMLSAPSQRFGYELNGHPIRRAAMSDRVYDGGYDKVEYAGGDWTIDPWAPRDKIYTWTRGRIQRIDLYEYQQFDLEGIKEFLAWAGASTAGIGTHAGRVLLYFLWYGQNFCRWPNDLMYIEDLSLDGLPVGKNH